MSVESDRLVVALREAVQAIDAAKVPAKLQEIAFAKSLDHLLGTPSQPSQPREQGAQREDQPDTSSDGALGRIAAKLGVTGAVAERVFEVDGGEVHLLVSRKVLGKSGLAAMREVAYLIAASRQAAGLEDETASNTIRQACERFGVLDPNNFGKAIKEVDGEGLRGSVVADRVAN